MRRSTAARSLRWRSTRASPVEGGTHHAATTAARACRAAPSRPPLEAVEQIVGQRRIEVLRNPERPALAVGLAQPAGAYGHDASNRPAGLRDDDLLARLHLSLIHISEPTRLL